MGWLGARNNRGQVPFEYALDGRNTQAYRSAPKINGTGGISAGDANNKYQAVNFRVEKQFAKGFNFLANYTISKNLETMGSGDSSYSQNGGTSLPLYAFDRSSDNGPPRSISRSASLPVTLTSSPSAKAKPSCATAAFRRKSSVAGR